ncbi:MAG: GAF domain-containing protein [Chloroflexi bacterium]|nr:GAF domain-containing protein [Chloroflexota bacterium]
MQESSSFTLVRARNDVAHLRAGLQDLSTWLAAQKASVPQAVPICEQLARIDRLLDLLNAELDRQDRERDQLQGLVQVSRTVNSSLDLEQVLNHTMDIIIQVTRAERGFLMLTDLRTGELTFRVARNMDHATISSPAFEVSRTIVQRVAATGQPVVTVDALHDPRFSFQDSVISLSLRSILCQPIKARERLIGVVYVDNRLRAGQFQARDLDALAAFTDQAAIAIENARLFESVRQNMDEIGALKTFQDNIFASIASGVIATDLSDRITAFNQAAEQILGLHANRLLGEPYQNALALLSGTPLPRLVETVKRAGFNRGAEIETSIPNRGPVNLNLTVSSLHDSNGQPLGVTIVVDDVTEKRHLEATREMFRRYVAPAVVDRLPADPEQLKLGGQRQPVTILFADIRGFTRLSEEIPPEKLVEILNQYLAVAAGAVLEQEGTLDKFMGDAVMALFNAPLAQPDHALRAARAALNFRRAISLLHETLPASLRLNFGIGIHTGEAVVGNVGTHQQMNYTAIGDAVNLAKRLQENAVGGRIIISARVLAQIHDQVQVTPLPPLKVKGRKQVEQVWELVGLTD